MTPAPLVLPSHDVGNALLASTYWLSRDPADRLLYLIAVDDMTPDHRRRLLAWLRRNADTMQAHARRTLRGQYRRGEISEASYTRRVGQLDDIEPAVWLEDTALVRRLVQLVPREESGPRKRRLSPTFLQRIGGRA